MKYKTTSGKTLTIKDENEINRGGEGRIMLVENQPSIVAKIFHNLTNNGLEQKLTYLHKLDSNIFVVPEQLLFKNSQLVGYTMQFVDTDYFPISAIFSKNYCQKHNIDFKFKKNIAKLLKNAVENAHLNNIVIGDFNQFNILINLQGDIKIIDTDSFETPNNKHSGVLLEDIRDYLYNGIVSKNSDFFALSVLVFYMLTFTHPFKGIHSQIKGLRDRMIHKLPVFAKTPELKTPKCYIPLSDKDLMNNFNKLYINGDRFLLSIDKDLSQTVVKTTVVTQKITEKNIIITPVLNNTVILNICFNDELGYIKTESEFIVFSAKNRGYLSKKFVISTSEYDGIFLGNNNILLRKKDKLFHFINQKEIVEIKNFKLSKKAKVIGKENILIVIEDDKMFWLFVDEILNNSIKNQRYEVFGKGFNFNSGLVQNSGSVKRIFYNSGKNISNIKIDKNIKSIYQNKNIGIIQFIDNNRVINEFFNIKANKIIFSNENLENIANFGYLQTSKDEGIIFEPSNNEIRVRRISDFSITSKIECSFISPQTSLSYCKSGIIAHEDNVVLLINSK